MMNMKRWIAVTALGGLLAWPAMAQAKGPKAPPGTRYVKALGRYVDTDILTVMDWREFFHHVRQTQGEKAAVRCLPDTSMIKAHYGRNVFASRAAGDRKLPIVGISPEQVRDYCVFRTEAVRQTKGFSGSRVTYRPLDAAAARTLAKGVRMRGVRPVGSTLPELFMDETGRMSVQGMPSADAALGFRCMAGYD